MSDGNFNRALLPHTPYASGLKAGKTMTRHKALEAFSAWIAEAFPAQTTDERSARIEEFRRLLDRNLAL